ncbi:TonB-dependent siderophore receptor [Neisseria leonii]
MNLFNKKPLALLLGGIFSANMLLVSAQAQAQTGGADKPAAETAELDTVRVKGERKSPTITENTDSYTTPITYSITGIPQELKDTVQSASVITSRRLRDQPDTNRVIDVVNQATGLHLSQIESDRYSLSSRGMGIDSISYDGVTTYYDTRFNYGDNHMDTALYDRVEVVRGATGFMTGPGNPSASINLVRKRPTKDFQGSIAAGAGSWNHYRIETDLSGRLNSSGSLRGRLVGVYHTRDSFLDRYNNRRHVLYGVLEADLGARTMLSAGANYQRNRSRGVMSGGLPLFYSDGTMTRYDRSANTAPGWGADSYNSLSAYLTLHHRFQNGWRLESNYTLSRNTRELKSAYVYGSPDPADNTGMNTAAISLIDGSRKQDSFDIKVNGLYRLFGREHAARFNYNFNRNHYDNGYQSPVKNTLPAKWGDFRRPDFPVPEPQWQSETFTALRGTITQHAASGITDLSLHDRLNLTLGARLTNYKVADDSFGPYFRPYRNRFNAVSKYFGLSYKLNDRYSLYGSYTDIFQPQTTVDASGKYLDPVIGGNYEIGLKGGLREGRLNFSVAAFETRRDNVAQPTGERLPGGQPVNRAVDGAKTRGFDAELAGSLTDNWNIQAGLTTFVARDAAGRRISLNTPNRIFKLFTTYRLPAPLQRMTVGGGVNWYSGIEGTVRNPQNEPVQVRADAYAVANLMARYDFTPRASLSVNVNNLFDKRYYTWFGRYEQYQYGAPRNALATFRYQF